MEIRDFAERILLSENLDDKLSAPSGELMDDATGPPLRLREPARPIPLQFAGKGQSARMPKMSGLHEPHLRAVAHHVMANHELQALEVMAWTLCAFPDAPPEFRCGIVHVMRDEQRHTRMHIKRMESLGLGFGELAVNGHVWIRSRESANLLDYLACLPLTFEVGNLDHSLEWSMGFEQAGDGKSRDVMRAIHEDEIEHVAFGLDWLRRLKPPDRSDWEVYVEHLRWPMGPHRAKGRVFQEAARRRATMTDEFIEKLREAERPQARTESRRSSE